MGQLLDRYMAGDHAEVWRSLVQTRIGIEDELLRADVWHIARETMRRVQQNIEVMVERLGNLGYEFESGSPFEKAPSDSRRMIDELNSKLHGFLPISLQAWYERIGSVDFRGHHPLLSEIAEEGYDLSTERVVLADPVVVGPIDALLSDFADWESGYWGDQPFKLLVSPDDLLKANISGDAYTIDVSAPCVDAVFSDWHAFTFVEYVREVCKWGGFPGWERYPNAPRELLSVVSRDLLSF